MLSQCVDESTIGIEEDGSVCVVVVQLFFQTPPPEPPEATWDVIKVPTFVGQVPPGILKECIIFLLDDGGISNELLTR
jgi:hypothetical protein